MRNGVWQSVLGAVSVLAGFGVVCLAGTGQKWDGLPEAVRATVLANGGVAGQKVDREHHTLDGKAVYEAGVKDKNGAINDLVMTEEGKLVEIKTDDASNKAGEQRAKRVLKGVTFNHPRDITNPYLPLASLKQDVLEGQEGGKKVRVERTALPDRRRTFKMGGQRIEALAVEDRTFEDGQLVEVATDYFAQDDDGAVYYLGEDVDEYEAGQVVGHGGAWMLGKDTEVPGVLLPGSPKVGDRFTSEDVSKEIHEDDEVVSSSETVTTPAGTYTNCLKVCEHLADGTTEYKYYARDVGVVRERTSDGDVWLVSHSSRRAP